MEFLHHSGVDIVCNVQSSLSNYEQLMLFMSRAGDPKNAFLIYFPLVYSLSRLQGRRLMLAAVVSEWLNIVFKWILFGHRPYWWVHESKHEVANDMDQFHLTCETGPGSPSGHAMVTAAVYYIIADASSHKLPKFIPHIIFLTAMIPINVARIFIAAHFPHQVVAGTICGVIIVVLLDKNIHLHRWHCSDYFITATALFLTCIGFSVTLGLVGVDLHWTIPLALKWCKNPEDWVSLGTTPYNSVTRDVSFLAGFGFSEYLLRHWRIPNLTRPGFKLLHCFIGLTAANALEMYQFQHTSMMSFYAYSAIKHFAIPIIVVFAIPFSISITAKQKTHKPE